jgi:hypothetical protein
MGADRIGLMIDLDYFRGGAEQPSVPGCPHIQARADAQHDVGLGNQVEGRRRGEAAGNAERPRVAGEETIPIR